LAVWGVKTRVKRTDFPASSPRKRLP